VKIGILGAGQLGRMLALAGYPLGFEFVFLDPGREACAASLGEHLCADYTDTEALRALCGRCDLVTYEFENVPAAAASFVAEHRRLLPSVTALTAGQDRVSEKQLFTELGIPVPRFAPVASRADLEQAVGALGLPCVLKTRRLGYDGKGQAVLRTPADVNTAWDRLGSQALILESFVAFEREVSMLSVRSRRGDLGFYPLVETSHREGILRTARPLARDRLQSTAETYARRVAERLDYVGVLAFEFFVSQGALLANEIAPRVHNSGHWSIEGAHCSQFENHLRAIAGLPLGGTRLRSPCAMVNFIGSAPDLGALAALPGVHPHLYGKSPKPQRKIGHATVVASKEAELDDRLGALIRLVESSAAANEKPAISVG
jgi:5-(carboxyamino)imidazole ribonucleotide synthase